MGCCHPGRVPSPFYPIPTSQIPFRGVRSAPKTAARSSWTDVCTPVSPKEPFKSHFWGYLLPKMVQVKHQSILFYVGAALLVFSLSSFFSSHEKCVQKYIFAPFLYPQEFKSRRETVERGEGRARSSQLRKKKEAICVWFCCLEVSGNQKQEKLPLGGGKGRSCS